MFECRQPRVEATLLSPATGPRRAPSRVRSLAIDWIRRGVVLPGPGRDVRLNWRHPLACVLGLLCVALSPILVVLHAAEWNWRRAAGRDERRALRRYFRPSPP